MPLARARPSRAAPLAAVGRRGQRLWAALRPRNGFNEAAGGKGDLLQDARGRAARPANETAPQPSVGVVGGETFPPEAQHPRTQEPEQPSSGRAGDPA